MPKIFLSPSNQSGNPYAYGNTNEGEQCGQICECATAALERCGFEVDSVHWDSMAAKCEAGEDFGADLYIPIHTNAYNQNVTGTEVFYYDMSSDGYEMAQIIYEEVTAISYGGGHSLRAYPTLYELRVPSMPAVYIEVDFHDNYEAAKWIVENKSDIGEAIAKACCRIFDMDYVPAKKTDPEPKPAPTGKLYHVQCGAFSKKENAAALSKQLQDAGFDNFIKYE